MVNALWKGGAEAVTIQGQRVDLHDRHQVRGQRGAAAGRALPAALRHRGGRRPGRLLDARSTHDDYLQVYRDEADDPDISVGWDLELEDAGHRAGVRRPARPVLRQPPLSAGRA